MAKTKQTKQQRIEFLEAELLQALAENERLNRDLNQTNEAQRIGMLLERHGILAWHAHHTTQREDAPEELAVPLICISGEGNPYSLDLFLGEEDQEGVVGIVVCREAKCVGMYGLIPSEYVLDEMDYQRKHGRSL